MTPRRARLRRAWRRLWTPPRRLRTTAVGRTYLVLTVGIGLAALNTGNNLLYLVLGLQLATIVVSGILSEQCVRQLRLRRVLPEAPHARLPFHLGWALSRPRGHAFALTLHELHAGLEGAVGKLAWLPPGEDRVVRAAATVGQRGPLLLTAVRISTTFPFGLFVKSRDLEVSDELLVLPARVPPPPEPSRPASGAGAEQRSRRGPDGGGDLAQLRELREGEDARRIHWTKSAQLGTLLRIERDSQPLPQVLLRLEEGGPPEALDRTCEVLAARAESLLGRGAEVGLELSGGLRLPPSSGALQARAILRALARAGHGAPP